MVKHSPPAWIDHLLEWYCADYYLEEVQGDLHEWYASVWSERTPRTANLRYFWAVVRYFSWFRLKPVHQLFPNINPLTMKNITILTFRHLMKDKLSGSVRIVNLVLGITTFMLAWVYAQYELNYDTHHQDPEQIYRFGFDFGDGAWAASPMGVGQAALDEFPEVAAMARFIPIDHTTITYEDVVFDERAGFWADSMAFDLLATEFVQGNPHTALREPSGIVLTESLAQKYFGEEDPMGKTVALSADVDFRTGEQPLRQVTGVIRDLPQRTHLQYDFLISAYLTFPDDFLRYWQNNWVYTYFRIPNPAHVAKVQQSIFDLAVEWEYLVEEEVETAKVVLTPVQQIHLYTNHEKEYADNGNIYYVYILLAIGGFVLLVSSINFINLTIIRGLDRAKEVGLRKTIGATRLQLIFQFLGETFVILFLSGLLSVFLLLLAAPLLQQFSGLALPLNVFSNPRLLLTLVFILAAIEILSGIYPAWVLSRMNPAEGVKSGGRSHTMRRVSTTRQGLIVAQFSLSILLTVGSLVVYQQLSYLQDKNLGFQKDQIMVFETTSDRIGNLEAFRDELRKIPGVENVTTSTDIPGWRVQLRHQRLLQEEEPEVTRVIYADENFVDTYGMEFVSGETFHTPMSRGAREFIVNEATIDAFFDGQDPLGEPLVVSGDTGTVVGIVKDFNFQTLHHDMEPLTLVNYPLSQYGNGSIRFQPEATEAVLAGVQAASQTIYPDLPPIDIQFLDDRFAYLYQAETRLTSMVWVFCLITLLLTLSGVLGVATYTARQRAKEVAIRKTLGSTIGQLLTLLSRNFVLLLGLACVLGTPAAYFLTDWWLQDFAYRVDPNPVWFLLGALALGVVVLSCSSGVILRTARTNPATVLKSE